MLLRRRICVALDLAPGRRGNANFAQTAMLGKASAMS
jgi:hypothetical protein